MYAPERQDQIRHLVDTDGRVAVVDLATRFGVTTETIRRDLDALERAGSVRRVHGGAVTPAATSTAEPSLPERLGRNTEAKAAIARRAADAIARARPGSVYLDAGSTTGALAREIAAGAAGNGFEVVTHSMTIAHTLAAADVPLTAIGGRVRGLTAAAVGADTVRAIEGLRPDIAVVGVNGLSADFGLSTPDPDEAEVKRAIVAAARRVVVVADADKLGAELLVSFARLTDVDAVVTDRTPDAALADALEDAGVEVWSS